MSDLIELLRRTAGDEKKFLLFGQGRMIKAADALEARDKTIAELVEALLSAKEELYYISHSSCDPDDSSNMDSVACAYRECRDAISQAQSKDKAE